MVTRRGFLKSSALLPGVLFSGSAQALVAGEPSRTARGAALQRAAHQLLEVPRVFDDPLALGIFGARGVAWLGRNLEGYRTAGARAMRAFLVMRSRFAEDELARAYARGVRQYVVLGAGLDTFAYRNPHRGLRVFEVDHPSTQAWKRSRLAEQSIGVPRSMRFAPVDFETQTLAGGLEAAGFRAGRPAFFSWLGVTIYLSKTAVAGTLGYIASLPRGSQVVFDFSPPLSELGDAERRGHEKSAANAARSGEPWIGYFSPAALVDEMRSGGFSSAQALGSGEMNQRYFRGRTDGFQVRGSGRIMAAQV